MKTENRIIAIFFIHINGQLIISYVYLKTQQ